MSVSINDLPFEILHNILRRFNGWSLLPCRLVCRRWRSAVDSLSDNDWKLVCGNDYRYDEYVAVRARYRLTWQETYRAVNSWSWWKTRRAKVTAHELCEDVNRFKVLPRGTIACLQNNRNKELGPYSDTIVYYDAETLQELCRENFDIVFLSEQYDESDDLWLFTLRDGTLCVVIKENKKKIIVGRLVKPLVDSDDWWRILAILFSKEVLEFTLIDKEVYFKNKDDSTLFVSKLVQVNGEPSVVTTQLSNELFEEIVIEFSIIDGKLHVLSNRGQVHLYSDGKFELVGQIDKESETAFLELREYGFNWRSRAVFFWVASRDGFANGFCAHSNVTITAFGYKVNIFYSANTPDCLQELYNEFECKPTKVIDMESVFHEYEDEYTFIPLKELDIVETGTYHKIVVAGFGRVVVLDLDDRARVKMKLRNAQKPLIVKKNLKTLKSSSNKPALKIHKYNTRSASKIKNSKERRTKKQRK